MATIDKMIELHSIAFESGLTIETITSNFNDTQKHYYIVQKMNQYKIQRINSQKT